MRKRTKGTEWYSLFSSVLFRVQLLESEGGEPLPAFLYGSTVKTEAYCSGKEKDEKIE
jgi:hypothetical protein